jgi:hypothetical protein
MPSQKFLPPSSIVIDRLNLNDINETVKQKNAVARIQPISQFIESTATW